MGETERVLGRGLAAASSIYERRADICQTAAQTDFYQRLLDRLASPLDVVDLANTNDSPFVICRIDGDACEPVSTTVVRHDADRVTLRDGDTLPAGTQLLIANGPGCSL